LPSPAAPLTTNDYRARKGPVSLYLFGKRAGARPTGAAGALPRAWLVGLGAVELRSHRAYTRNQLRYVMRGFLTMPGRLDGQS
jgi:hypothetical protein